MEVVDVELCVVAKCPECGNQFSSKLPVQSEVQCHSCGREIYFDTELLNRVEVMRAQFVATLCRQRAGKFFAT